MILMAVLEHLSVLYRQYLEKKILELAEFEMSEATRNQQVSDQP